ncbi:MAG: hypothetical protein OXG79_12440 [Chloroflexi bacterium]|nr:hypothetical protein [Chloroflexota bacterium]
MLTRPSSRYQEPAVLIRQAPGERVGGRAAPGPESRTSITIETAPAPTGMVRDVAPEGARLQDWRVFYAYVGVALLHLTAGADEIEYGGRRYRVRTVRDYRPHGPIEVLANAVSGP